MFSSYVADPSTPYVATTQRWSPFFGGTLASAHVHPTPTTCLWSSPPLPDGGDRRTPRVYAVRARSRAVCALTYCLGSVPSVSTMDSRAYGTRASRSVRDAPGTAITHPRDCAAPPVTCSTARIGEACTASSATRSAGSIVSRGAAEC